MRNKVSPKSTNQATSALESIAPLRWFNVLLGLSILERPTNQRWTKLSTLYALARWAIYSWILAYTILHLNLPVKEEFKLALLMIQTVLATNIIITFISTFIGLRSCEKVKECLKKVSLADKTLEVFGIDPEYDEEYRDTLIRVVVWIGISLVMVISTLASLLYHNYTWIQAIFLTSIYEYPLIINPTVDLNFVVCVRLVGRRFERLNAVLQSIAINSVQPVHSTSCDKYQTILRKNEKKVAVRPNYYSKNRSNVELLMKVTRQLHLDLCGTARKINDFCCIQISLQMGATFMLMTGFSYCLYILYNLTSVSFSEKSSFYILMGKWMLVSTLRTFYVLHISVQTTKEAEKSPRIAQEVIVPGSQKRLVDEIHQFSLQTMQHPFYFSASGLIVLDFSYIRGFAGSVVTYLMILIQNQRDIIEVGNLIESVKNETSLTS